MWITSKNRKRHEIGKKTNPQIVTWNRSLPARERIATEFPAFSHLPVCFGRRSRLSHSQLPPVTQILCDKQPKKIKNLRQAQENILHSTRRRADAATLTLDTRGQLSCYVFAVQLPLSPHPHANNPSQPVLPPRVLRFVEGRQNMKAHQYVGNQSIVSVQHNY
jgi:hypothetical protein